MKPKAHTPKDCLVATLRKDKTTQPTFTLRTRTNGHAACPCSTKGYWRRFRNPGKTAGWN